MVGGDTILENEGFDTDDDGKPDFLDFDEVTIRYVQASSSPASINVSAPTVLVFEELKSLDVGEPDAVSVNLQAGTEYTVEFSRNLTDPIESLLPVIEILDPVSKEPLPYFFSDGTLPDDRIQIAAYPEEKPSLVCLTFRPSVSGEYVIKISGLYMTADEAEDYTPVDSTEEFYSMIVDAIGQDEADELALLRHHRRKHPIIRASCSSTRSSGTREASRGTTRGSSSRTITVILLRQ